MTQQMIVAIFPTRAALVQALDRIKEIDDVTLLRAAIIAKAASGETIVIDDQLTPNEGGIAGSTLGAAITAFGLAQLGALALPGVGVFVALGVGAMAGALVGGLTGRFAATLLDAGFRKDQVSAIAHSLKTNRPVLIVQLQTHELELIRLRGQLQKLGAELVEAEQPVAV